MKFDVVIGNPPYQQNVGNKGGNKAKAKSIYHLFIDEGIKLANEIICYITPSRWMTLSTEGIPTEFVENIISSNKIKSIVDFEDATSVFPNVEIKGGISYFIYDKKYCGEATYSYVDKNNIVSKNKRFLKIKGLDFVIRKNIDVAIVEKILKVDDLITSSNSFSTMISPKDFFTTKNSLTSSWDKFAKEKSKNKSIKIYVNKANHGVDFGYIGLDDLEKNKEYRKGMKVYIPAAGGTGNDSTVLGTPFIGEDNSVCSQTYLVIGWDYKKYQLDEEQCSNIVKYIKTKFFRYMVSIKKKTQSDPRGVYQLVPMQNFRYQSDIDWSKSIFEIDEQLFDKYAFSPEERNHIKSSIKEM